MVRLRLDYRTILVCLVMLCCQLLSRPGNAQEPGVIVETVTTDSIAVKAGVQVGDRLLTYANRPLLSPYALTTGIANTFAKEMVLLRLQRSNAIQTVKVRHGDLGISVRPEMSEAVHKLYVEGKDLLQAEKQTEAVEKWVLAAQQAKSEGDNIAAAWLYGQTGYQEENAHRWQDEQSDFSFALPLAQASKDSAAQAEILSALGYATKRLNDLDAAQQWYLQAKWVNVNAGNKWWISQNLFSLGLVAYLQRAMPAAEEFCKRAVESGQRLAPISAAVAEILDFLGDIAAGRNDFATAEKYQRQIMSIRQQLKPLDSSKLAGTRANLAADIYNQCKIAREQGAMKAEEYYHRMSEAEGHYQYARKIFEAHDAHDKHDPFEMFKTYTILAGLGTVTYDLDHLAESEGCFNRALKILQQPTVHETNDADSSCRATILSNLGAIAVDRGRYNDAERYDNQALQIRDKLGRKSKGVADCYINLGTVAQRRRDLDKAEDYYRQALHILEEINDPLPMTIPLQNLGAVATERGDLDSAEYYHKRVLKLFENMASNSIGRVGALISLGGIAAGRDHLSETQYYFQRALDIMKKFAPDSLGYASCLNNMGAFLLEQGDRAAAENDHRHAVKLYEQAYNDTTQALALYKKLAPALRMSP